MYYKKVWIKKKPNNKTNTQHFLLKSARHTLDTNASVSCIELSDAEALEQQSKYQIETCFKTTIIPLEVQVPMNPALKILLLKSGLPSS